MWAGHGGIWDKNPLSVWTRRGGAGEWKVSLLVATWAVEDVPARGDLGLWKMSPPVATWAMGGVPIHGHLEGGRCGKYPYPWPPGLWKMSLSVATWVMGGVPV